MKPTVCRVALSCMMLTTAFALIPMPARSAPAPVLSPLLATLKPSHPRLMASETTWHDLQTRRQTDAALDAFLRRGELEARALLEVPPIPYKKDGKRLLHVSRVVLRRVVLLSMQYHLTGDVKLAERAQVEMLNAAAFADWNPEHFLDVGEMTTALAIGYDWLSQDMPAATRQSIKAAIIAKGLRPGLIAAWWQHAESNWNQVCLAGLSLGALAIADEEPDLAAQILQHTKDGNTFGLKVYAPVGVYPEGPMYWGYGTTFEAVLLDSLRSALGTDWGLSQSPGFLQCADVLLQAQGPSGTFFNYSDGVERPSLEGGSYWFAHALKRPQLVRLEADRMRRYTNPNRPAEPNTENDRLLPLSALWWPIPPQGAALPAPAAPTAWYGAGINPLASFRSSWDDSNAMYLALKGGSASLNHAHMDAGSFVFEADGVRWARDLGMQDYAGLEAKKIDLWNMAQNGGRWTVFRLNNFSHNTLTINNQLHRVDGKATITHFAAGPNAGAIVDLSSIFAGQATRVTRGFAFRAGHHVLIRDELEGLKAGDTVRWAMLTKAQITLIPTFAPSTDVEATLTQDGKTLHVRLHASVPVSFAALPAQAAQNDYDEANPGAQLLVFNVAAPASGRLNWAITLEPGSTPDQGAHDPLTDVELRQWPQPLTE